DYYCLAWINSLSPHYIF
nr:immunoglobulin light chain junction region [Macaca mulatta]MOY09231.1 immunoglobulin light chain junction region [Macaca mulatta]